MTCRQMVVRMAESGCAPGSAIKCVRLSPADDRCWAALTGPAHARLVETAPIYGLAEIERRQRLPDTTSGAGDPVEAVEVVYNDLATIAPQAAQDPFKVSALSTKRRIMDQRRKNHRLPPGAQPPQPVKRRNVHIELAVVSQPP